MFKMPSPRSAKGFTAIELLVTIAILGVLAAIAAPSFKPLIERWKVRQVTEELQSTFYVARSEAIKRGIQVVVCRSANAETSNTPTCAASGTGWESGWIVFADRNTNEQMSWSSGDSDVLLRVQGAITDSGGIEQNAFRKLVFRPTGLMSAGASQMTFNSKSLTSSQQRRVCVTIAGRTRVINNSTDTCES